MEFKGTTKSILVANIPDSRGDTQGMYELYTSPFGMGIIGYAENQSDALLFSKSYKMLKMLEHLIEDEQFSNESIQLEVLELIKEATEL